MSHRIQCQCGALSGEVSHTSSARRAICYCRDCQDYASRLGRLEETLDANGGTDVVATQARYVTITRGIENLACASLSGNGLLRWYAKCCNTPIANTPREWRFCYVGLVHSCLEKPLEHSFPRIDMRVNNRGGVGTPPRPPRGQLFTILAFMLKFLPAWVGGAYKQTPFFTATGEPVVAVQILSADERIVAEKADA